jgi:hypothetical protein
MGDREIREADHPVGSINRQYTYMDNPGVRGLISDVCEQFHPFRQVALNGGDREGTLCIPNGGSIGGKLMVSILSSVLEVPPGNLCGARRCIAEHEASYEVAD